MSLRGLDPEHRAYVRSLLERGWVLRRATRTGHLKIKHMRSGRTLAVAGSPGDYRSLRNFRHQVRRIEQSK